jgi:putative mRNA 3-end processing factor
MHKYPIGVSPDGGIVLGTEIICDGFSRDIPYRVQTHVHTDHLTHFNASKGKQDILLSEITRDLLVQEFNADLPYRQNLKSLPLNQNRKFGTSEITFRSSGHMLGAVQVQVRTKCGFSVGYSGDFGWPLDNVIQVDALVLDSSYGSPDSVRLFSQDEAEAKFLELVLDRTRIGPTHVKAHRGTLHRSLQALSGELQIPLLGSPRLCREVEIYKGNGYSIDPVTDATSPLGKEILRSANYVRFFTTRDKQPVCPECKTSIVLSAYMTQPDNPLLQYSDSSFCIAMSDHADFNETLEYVRATGAKFVLTDNSRNGKAATLASEIKARLGIPAEASQNVYTREWGA